MARAQAHILRKRTWDLKHPHVSLLRVPLLLLVRGVLPREQTDAKASFGNLSSKMGAQIWWLSWFPFEPNKQGAVSSQKGAPTSTQRRAPERDAEPPCSASTWRLRARGDKQKCWTGKLQPAQQNNSAKLKRSKCRCSRITSHP